MKYEVTHLPRRGGRNAGHSMRRGEVRESKVCLFLPELLWVALRRRAAQQGVSALHLVRLALENFEPDWREHRLVERIDRFEGREQDVRRFPKAIPKETLWNLRNPQGSEDDSEGLGLLVEGKDIGEVAVEAARGVSARSRAIEVWGLRASVVLLERELHRSRQSGQPSLFTARQLVGV